MGMSSSQARLLTLTARMHDIEHRAQKIEADKLRLANDSRKAYEEYLIALDSKKIQYKSIASDGSITFRDATMNIMENGSIPDYTGEHAMKNLFLQNQQGMIMVTPAVARAFGLDSWASTTPMDDYIEGVTGKHKSTREIFKTVMVDDPDTITGFTPIANTLVSNPSGSVSHTFSPVENEEGGVDYEALNGYAKFIDTHSTASGNEITGTTALTDLTSGGSYQIKTAEGLKQLATLSGSSLPTGITITIANDIDMSGISGWTGIQNFGGTFNGNGYKISNLSGSNGLFASTTAGATIKNVAMENVNINGSSYVGGLIGSANCTDVENCYSTGTVKGSSYAGGLVGNITGVSHNKFNNVYSSAKVIGSGGTGGLIGYLRVSPGSIFDLSNCYAIGDVQGTSNTGGLIGYAYYDQDVYHFSAPDNTDITDIENAYAGGNVSGTSSVGGFVGYLSYWGDGDDYCEIRKCMESGTVTGTDSSSTGAFVGTLKICLNSGAGWNSESQKYVNFIDCGYSSTAGPTYKEGEVLDEGGADQRSLVNSSGSGSGLVEFNLAGSVPSIGADGSGAYMSNILGVLTKAGLFDACDDTDESASSVNAMKSQIANFLGRFSNNNTDNTKLWYLNIAMFNYLNTGSESYKTLAQAL